MNDSRKLHRSAGFFASAALLTAITTFGASGNANAAACLQDAAGLGSLNCTANDVRIATILVTNIVDACDGNPGDTFTFDGNLSVESSAARNDIGFYIASDPLNGADCSVTLIPQGVSDTDGDVCGDTVGGNLLVPVTNLTAPCQDGNGDGFFDVNTCSSWKQNVANDCADSTQAIPGTKSKCNCEVVPTDLQVPNCNLPEYADACEDNNPCTNDICNPQGSGLGDLFGCSHTNNTNPCRASAGVCDVAENCTNGACPADGFLTSSCRASTGVCDPSESCTGSSAACPTDSFLTSVCRAANGVCDAAESCDGSSGACPADGFSSGNTCRASDGVCDVAETCGGSSADCPANGFASSSTVCRADAGQCDVADTCTGSSAVCPSDGFEPQGTDCAFDENPCTDDECDGAGACVGGENSATCDDGLFCNGADTCIDGACTGHAGDPCAGGGICGDNCSEETDNCFDSAATVCRPSSGVCDTAESCTGSSEDCPTDAFSSGNTCRASGGICDVAETCDGSNADCPADGFASSASTCRGSAGVCDVAEQCTGSSGSCPADAFSQGNTCRATNGVCDVAETCSGSAAGCPIDAFTSGGTCRASAGVCDVAETCSGASANCPANGFTSGGTCRASAGVCDVGETCSGNAATCPNDGFVAGGTVCRADAGDCDVAETCTGAAASCPAQGFEPSGTTCTSDGNVCTNDQCNGSGTCQHPNNTSPCDDGLFCTVSDTCGAGQCNGTPRVCGDQQQCTIDTCNETTNSCQFDPQNDRCDDEDQCTTDICNVEGGCSHIFSCADICRSSNFYSKRSSGDDNVVQQILDATDGLYVCGEYITETSINNSVEGLGLDSALEGLCVRSDGIEQRSLYRELVATALNCAMSGGGGDAEFCDEVLSRFVEVDFTSCNALCAGESVLTGEENHQAFADDCIDQLKCYNNGGVIINGKCAYGRCDVTKEYCGGQYGTCPPISVISFPILQVCERLSDNCKDEKFCQEGLDVCPSNLGPTSSRACRDAKRNDCTIDLCSINDD